MAKDSYLEQLYGADSPVANEPSSGGDGAPKPKSKSKPKGKPKQNAAPQTKAQKAAQFAQQQAEYARATNGGKGGFLPGVTAKDIAGLVQLGKDTHPFPKEMPIGDVGEQFDKSGAVTEINGRQTDAGKADAKNNHVTTAPPGPPKPTGPSPAVDLMNSLVGQYQAAMGVVNPYINGSVGAGAVADATAAGASMGGPTAPAPAAASGIDANLAADAQAYQKANDAGAGGVQTAMKNTGLADQQYLNVSPYMGLLNSLQQEATWKQEQAASGGAGIPLPAGAPPGLTAAVAHLASSATNSSGAIPVGGGQPVTSQTNPSSNNSSTAGGGNG